MYLVQKNLTKIKNNQCTGFLDPKELEEVRRKLEKNSYSFINHIRIVRKRLFIQRKNLRFYFMK